MFLLTVLKLNHVLGQHSIENIEFTEKDIVDSLLKLLDRLLKIKQPGEIIMIEEVSVLFPSRRAMTSDNVAMGRILDTIRKKQAILISNAPLYPSIDSHMRAMAEILVECQKVMRKDKLVKAKAWILQTSPHSGKTYRHTFRRGQKKVMFHYSKQSNPLIREEYEKEKDKFILHLLEKLHAKAENTELKEKGTNTNESAWVQDEIFKLMTEKKMKIKEVSKEMGISIRKIYRHLNILSDKGRNPTIYLEKSEKLAV